jgi:hypothetical protein
LRLQLIALATIALGGLARAESDDEPAASATLRLYTDDDHVTVVSPAAGVRVMATPQTAITIDTTVDAVSAASVDVTTSASPRTVSEQRVELGVLASYRIAGPSWLTLGVRGSHENDYDAARLRVGARRELAQRNATLSLDYVLSADRAGSVVDPMFSASRTGHQVLAGITHLLDARTIAELIVDGRVEDGYFASPYRVVLVEQAGSPLAMPLAEITPSSRLSIALATRLRRAFGARWATTATYRYYRDDWSIDSHTMLAELHRELPGWLFGLSLRGYVQDAAAFYRARYDGVTPLRTRDRTLGAMRSAYAAFTVDHTLDDDDRWHLVASAGALRFWFLDFPAQADRNALLLHTGVTTTW